MAREEKSGVEKLKNKLYARDSAPKGKTEDRTALSPSEAAAPKSWKDIEPMTSGSPPPLTPPPLTPVTAPPVSLSEPPAFSHMSFAAKFLIGSVAFFVLATGVASLVFFGGVNTTSPSNIDLEIVAPSLVDGGKEVQLELIIRNRNTTPLLLADLVLDYPDGSRNPKDPAADLSHERLSIGTIESGQELKRTVSVLLFGEEGQQQEIKASLEYSVQGSNAVFVKESNAIVMVGSSPVSLSIDAPDEVIAGQDFSIDITVRSNSTAPVTDLVVKGEYPFGFSMISSDPRIDTSQMWRLGTLDPGESVKIRMRGVIEGQDGDERIFRFIAGANDDATDPRVKVPYLTIPQTLTIQRPFIAGGIAIEGQTGKNIAVVAGSQVDGTVTWQNNLSEPVSNVEIMLAFEGPALDEDSIEGQGAFFQSLDNSLIWSKDENSELESVAPGGRGTFAFSFMTKTPGQGGVLITNPTIDVNLTVRAVREGGDSEVVLSAASSKVTVASALSLSTETLHFSGPFNNTGPMPPRAESATTYTVRWTVRNSANTVGNGLVTATLPTYVDFVAAESGSGITYNEGSRTVTWSLGEVKAGAGYTAAARTGAFRVEIVPSTSQIGTSPNLTSAPKLTGQDRFAGVNLETEGQAATTELVGDTRSGMDEVQPQ